MIVVLTTKFKDSEGSEKFTKGTLFSFNVIRLSNKNLWLSVSFLGILFTKTLNF